MKTLLAILAFFTLTGVTSATIAEASCSSQSDSGLEKIGYQMNGELNKKGDTLTITLSNYANLTGVEVKSDDGDILEVSKPDSNGVITVTAEADSGTADVLITADHRQPLEIPITITARYPIDVTIDKQAFRIGEVATLTFNNFDVLSGIKVTANPSNNVQIGPIDSITQTAKITGLSQGVTTLTINADNAEAPVTMELNIQPKLDIEATIDKTELKVGETATVTISNPSELVNLQVSASPSGNVEIGQINPDGTVTITAQQSGATTITISANNGNSKTLSLEVAAKIAIEATLDNTTPEINDTVNLQISNFDQLVNLQVTADNSDSVNIGTIDANGNVAITILKGGNIIISVNADNATSAWSGTIRVQNKVDILATIDKTEIWTQNNAIVSISNYAELVNVTVQASPTASVKIGEIDANGNVEITGLIADAVVITIAADNANAPFELNLLINPRIQIQATIDSTNLKVGQETTIRITNPDQFQNLQIIANPSESVSVGAINADGTATVQALKSGMISFIISADNGTSATLNLSIDALIAIAANVGSTDLWVGQTTSLTISNFAQLVNVEVAPDTNQSVEIGAIDENGVAMITVLKAGQIAITITADNAQAPKQISLNLQDLLTIQASIDNNHLQVGQTGTITIANAQQLENLQVVADVTDAVEIGAINPNGTIIVKALQPAQEVTITISADNGTTTTLTLTIADKIQIDFTIEKIIFWVGETTTLTVNNFNQLVNFTISAQPSGNVTIAPINDQGEFLITGLQVGETDLYLNADNAVTEIKIDLTIEDKIQIDASIDQTDLQVGQTATITITNPAQLQNLQVSANPSGNVQIGPIGADGTVTVTALAAGSTTISITADNGITKTLGVTVAAKIAIQATAGQTNLWIGDNTTITIANFNELVNLQVEVDQSGHAEIGAIDSQGRISVTALSQGPAVVTITADNAIEPVEITFSIEQKIQIDASIDKTNLQIGETATITISNPAQLTNLQVSADPSGNVEIGPINSDGTVTVTGLNSGAATITISADNGISKDLSISIAGKVGIVASAAETGLWVGQTTILTINNFAQLTNLQVSADSSNNVEIGNMNDQGQINITALAQGASTVTINADNALAPVQIIFNITPKVSIDATIDKTNLWINDSATITISNFAQLVNPQVQVDQSQIVQLGPINNDGTINVQALMAGNAAITISADNGVNKVLNVVVAAKIVIDASIDKTDLQVGETATITITDPSQFENLQVVADPSVNVEIGAIGSDGTITVTALNSGSTTITLTADNGISKTFTLTIADKITIDASISDANLWVDKTATLTISNFAQLVNLQVAASGSGSVQLGTMNGQGQIIVTATMPGAVNLTISADNAVENQVISLNITAKVNIDASIDKANLWVGDTATITINNYPNLVNPQISATPGGIVQIGAINPDGTISVQALNQGAVTITITADNGISKVLNITISSKIVIAASIDQTDLKVGETATITITNPQQLINLQVSATPGGVVQIGAINPDGTVSVQALNSGSATISITADNGITKVLNLTVDAEIAIQATIDKNNLWIGDTATITISNFAQLVNLQVSASPSGNVQLGQIDSQGRVAVTGLAAGATAITINASNGISPVVLNVTVAAKLTINASIDKTTIRVGETATLTVANFASLTNLQVSASPSGNVSLSPMNAQGQVTVTGLTAGTTTLSVTADNGITVTFTLTVPSLVTIIASANPTSIPILGISTITITNIAQLVGVTGQVISGSSLVNINLGNISQGIITIIALSLPGTIAVKINALNAVSSVTINITIRLL